MFAPALCYNPTIKSSLQECAMMPGNARRRWIATVLLLVWSGATLLVSCGETAKPVDHLTPTATGSVALASVTASTTATRTPVSTSGGGMQLVQVSSDPYSGDGSQHATEVEPSSYAYGTTIVAAFQAGRYIDEGASNIGWTASEDGGATWLHGFLPGTTVPVGGNYSRLTDPAVVYDAAHRTWMIAMIAFLETQGGLRAAALLVSLSTNGGTSWGNPVTVTNTGAAGGLDKDWITCDISSGSRYYGNCYIEWDNYNRGHLIEMSTSRDGGQTWGAAVTTVNQAAGFAGYPLVQPDGNVIVPISNASQTAIMVFGSTDGGASWSRPQQVTDVTSYSPSAFFRDDILLTPAIDGAGQVYLVWVDCRFEPGCTSNDLVMSTSRDGVSWSAARRIPIAPIGSAVDYYVSGLGVDGTGPGVAAHLGLAFYYFSSTCYSDCSLEVGYVSSLDGGATWSAKSHLAGPMLASWVAQGNNKVGDYITASFSGGRAFPFFEIATAPVGGHFNEALYTVEGGL
jgi:hypothetical protein